MDIKSDINNHFRSIDLLRSFIIYVEQTMNFVMTTTPPPLPPFTPLAPKVHLRLVEADSDQSGACLVPSVRWSDGQVVSQSVSQSQFPSVCLFIFLSFCHLLSS